MQEAIKLCVEKPARGCAPGLSFWHSHRTVEDSGDVSWETRTQGAKTLWRIVFQEAWCRVLRGPSVALHIHEKSNPKAMISLERQAWRKSHEAKTTKLGPRILQYTGTIGHRRPSEGHQRTMTQEKRENHIVPYSSHSLGGLTDPLKQS